MGDKNCDGRCCGCGSVIQIGVIDGYELGLITQNVNELLAKGFKMANFDTRLDSNDMPYYSCLVVACAKDKSQEYHLKTLDLAGTVSLVMSEAERLKDKCHDR